jgi:dipeptidase D
MMERSAEMKSKKLIVAALVLLSMLTTTAFGSSTNTYKKSADDSEIIENILDNFYMISKIPRPSHHEKQISDFLVNFAKDQGFSPIQDDIYNVMFDIPATEGYENLPLCVLQGHMDMVALADEEKEFDPLTDTVTIIRDEKTNTLIADGTTLGADDGAGLSIIMAVAQGKMDHGPLRVIITTGEEDGMEGVFNLDPSWLDGVQYLINIDNEDSDNVLISTASGDSVRFSKKVKYADAVGDTALEIELEGLKGGHSGVDIDKLRLNGVVGLANFLKELDNKNIDYELASFEGGIVSNAIPSDVSCIIVVSEKDANAVKEAGDAYLEKIRKDYDGIEDGITLSVTALDSVPQVIGKEDKENMIRLATEIIDGVYTWSANVEGLVDSSSNLGILTLENGEIIGVTCARSSSGKMRSEIIDSQFELAKSCGFQIETKKCLIHGRMIRITN